MGTHIGIGSAELGEGFVPLGFESLHLSECLRVLLLDIDFSDLLSQEGTESPRCESKGKADGEASAEHNRVDHEITI
jgi:hypothetical protein